MRGFSSVCVITSDRERLFFACKFCIVILLLLASAHFGAGMLAMRWYTSVLIDERANLYLLQERERATAATLFATHAHAAGVAPIPLSTHREHIDISKFPKQVVVDFDNQRITLLASGTPRAAFHMRASSPVSEGWRLAGAHLLTDKHTDLYSPLAQTHLPYVVRFSEHILIHGQPYSAQTNAETRYAVAGIEIRSADAQKLFQFVDEYTISVVHGMRSLSSNPLVLTALSPPRMSARAWALADLETGDILLEHNARTSRPIASITKLMTALIASEYIGMDREVPLWSRREQYSVSELLHPLLMRSDNTVAHTLATFRGEEWFLSHMNAKAATLAMTDTIFADASGLSAYNRSSARDLVRFARYLFEEHRDVLAASKRARAEITDSLHGHVWNMKNQNRYAGDPHFLGGKLGFTDEAGRTGLSIVSLPTKTGVRVVAVVVLGSDDWKRDSDALIAWFARASAH